MPDPTDPRADDPDRRPLDELFIVGAKYHEPSAAERAAAAKRADKERKKQELARKQEIERTRRALGGTREPDRGHDRGMSMSYEMRRSVIAIGALVAIAIALSFTGFVR